MRSLDDKLIVYDSNCKVCSSLRSLVLTSTRIPREKIRSYRELSPEQARLVDISRFRNGMALIDTSGGATLYGDQGVAYIFSNQYRIVDVFLRFRPIATLFNFLYKTLAYNRYVIATPKHRFVCNCQPDRIITYRMGYIVITILIAVFLTAVFGITLRGFFAGISRWDAAFQMLLMAGTGWVIQIGFAAVAMKDKALDYAGHLGSIMVVGLLLLLPWILLYSFTGTMNPYLPAVSVFVSSTTMLYLHVQRIKYLELSQAWTVSWFVLLQATAFFWIWFFHINQGV